jgi:glyoxylase-like metal-dependent hydrolase (beta-lactamase superfamily II)
VDDQFVEFGNSRFKVIFTPGHSPGSICFYESFQAIIISGDVLFRQSIGRTDLPGGDHNTLMNSISQRLLLLPDRTTLYCGHGPATTIGNEKKDNPFLIN